MERVIIENAQDLNLEFDDTNIVTAVELSQPRKIQGYDTAGAVHRDIKVNNLGQLETTVQNTTLKSELYAYNGSAITQLLCNTEGVLQTEVDNQITGFALDSNLLHVLSNIQESNIALIDTLENLSVDVSNQITGYAQDSNLLDVLSNIQESNIALIDTLENLSVDVSNQITGYAQDSNLLHVLSNIQSSNTAVINTLENLTVNVSNQLTGFATETTLNNIYTNTPKTLRQLRSEGKCFNISIPELSIDETPDDNEFLLCNPSDSGKTLYLYNLNLSWGRNATTTATTFLIFLYRSTSTTTSTAGVIQNLKFNDATAFVGKSEVGTGFTKTILIQQNRLNLSDGNIYNDYQEEFIEIPPGYSVIVSFGGYENDDKLNGTLRVIQTDEVL